ncbi:MAG: hypothetical protein ACOVMH_06685 [Flavobacterium sp.]|jgi:hypothetical protein
MNTKKTMILLIMVLINNLATAQVWSGTTSGIQTTRTGNVTIGPATPAFPNDTKLYVRNDPNQKVSFLAESRHTQDFQFGVVSAVDRAKTKAFSVLLKTGTTFNDTFVVFGNGNVIATEVRVKTPIFPDYVFDKEYKLMSLYDLEKYIDANNHLPNIPSADEIITNGLELGNMQVKQMEKIEELTLYIIQLKKEMDLMKKEIDLLINK